MTSGSPKFGNIYDASAFQPNADLLRVLMYSVHFSREILFKAWGFFQSRRKISFDNAAGCQISPPSSTDEFRTTDWMVLQVNF